MSLLLRFQYQNRSFYHTPRYKHADKTDEILINYNGDIFACTARDFLSKSILSKLQTR